MDLWLTLPPGKKVYKVHERWAEASSVFYAGLTRTLLSGDGERGRLPESACIQPGREGEWLLSLSWDTDEQPLVILLSLPDEQTALLYGLQWERHAEALRQLLLEQLLKEEK